MAPIAVFYGRPRLLDWEVLGLGRPAGWEAHAWEGREAGNPTAWEGL